MPPKSIIWQRLDEPGLEEVRLSFGENHAFRANGSLLHATEPVNLSYSIHVGKTGLVEQAEFIIHEPKQAKLMLARGTNGEWHANGQPINGMENCIDIDLECCGLTNALPIRRLQLMPGESAALNVLFIRIPSLVCLVCPQQYTRLPDENGSSRYRYQSPGFEAVLTVDDCGFTHEYSQFLSRVASE